MNTDERIENIWVFVSAVCGAVKKCYEAEFTCPICNGKAHATKSTYNQHVHAYCEGCDMRFMQ